MYATDLVITRDNTLPIFATGKAPIEYTGRYHTRDERESDVMATRWKVFTFHDQYPGPRPSMFHPVHTVFTR